MRPAADAEPSVPGRPPPRVGMDASRAFTQPATGTEVYSTMALKHLLRRGRFRYRLYRRAPLAEAPQGAELRVLAPDRLWTHLALAGELRRHPPELLFVPAHVLPLWPRLRSVVTVHDLGYLAFPETHTPFQRWYLDWSTRRHVRLATRLMADSGATRADLVRHYGADPSRVDVVHLGVDPDLAPAATTAIHEVRRRLGLPPQATYFLHVGTIQPRKNLERLVSAFAAATADAPDTWLVLAGGQGWGLDGSLGRARDLGVEERVLRTGYLDHDDLAPLYSGAVAVLLPSLYEGFGLTGLEAMACGAPLACSNTSSLPEVVGEAALLFDPLSEPAMARAIRRLLTDADERQRLTAAGRQRVSRFTWEVTAAGIESTLAAALVDGP